MKINAVTDKGGAVELNKSHGVWASYAVASVAGLEPSELFYAQVKLASGKTVQFFTNRETGLVAVDIIDPKGKSGREVLRDNF